ncbi:MAG: FAD-dependent monooxygenase, partial [Lacipirellulaceae bacterium]
EDASPLGSFRMVNSKNQVLMRGDAGNVDIATPSINVHRADLHRALDSAAEALCIERRLGCEVVEATQHGDKVEVKLNNGHKETGDLLIGAEGVRSRTRKSLLGEEAMHFRSSRQTCWRFALEAPDLMKEETIENWAPGRRAGIVPLSRGRLYVYLVMSDWWNPDAARENSSAFLQQEFGGISKALDEVLERVDPKLTLHADELAEQPHIHFGTDRILLIGDAAHAMTPNLGQGAGMAIEDAATLALIYAELQNHPERIAAELTKQRMTRVKKVQKTSWRIGQIAHTKNPVLRTVRDWLLQRMSTAATEKQATSLWGPGLELGERVRVELVNVAK